MPYQRSIRMAIEGPCGIRNHDAPVSGLRMIGPNDRQLTHSHVSSIVRSVPCLALSPTDDKDCTSLDAWGGRAASAQGHGENAR